MLDERVRDDLKSAASAVRSGSPALVDAVKRRGRRRRQVKRAVWILLSGVPVVVFIALAVPFDPNAIDPAGTHGVETVEIADLAVPVADGEPLLTDPDVWEGLRGPQPRFDTTPYGPDLSFRSGEPVVGDLSDRVKRAVYLGELDGEAIYVYSQAAPSIWDRISEMVFGNLSGDTIGTSLYCCTGGDMDREGGFPGLSSSFGTGEPDLIVAEWLGLTPGVAVVAFQIDGQFIGWQTPVGGVVSLRLDEVPNEFVMVAISVDGNELDRYDPQELARIPPSAAGSPSQTFPDLAGFVSEELEVELSNVRSAQLRDLIEFGPDSRLYEVPVEGSHVYVVISWEEGHFYSESCEVLESAAVPDGLRATCLERMADGVTETGVFNLHEDSD